MDEKLALPKALVDQVAAGQVVLFLGAGATYGATHPDGAKPPLGQKLASMLAERFLGPSFEQRPLAEVAELAISETDLFSVQDFITDIFKGFGPAEFHKLVPLFIWPAIATTNYDLVFERSYDSVTARLQKLVPFIRNEDRVEQKLRDPDTVPYLKLHGCMTCAHDTRLPLILTPDQYVLYRSGRDLLFDRLKQYAHNYPFLFVGYKLADQNLRQTLLSIVNLGDARPRSYMLSPGITEPEERFWASRKITCIKATFEDFLKQLDGALNRSRRKLAKLRDHSSLPIIRHFSTSAGRSPSESLLTFLKRDVEHMHQGFQTGDVDAKAFYSGYFHDWSPIAHDLDVPRGLADAVIADAILEEADADSLLQQFFVIKGHAGSGKTVLLHRIAWESGVSLGALSLFVRPSASLLFDPLAELYDLSKTRIHLFVDCLAQHSSDLMALMAKSRTERVPITVIGTVRQAEWNDINDQLDAFVTQEYEMHYLNETEIVDLLDKLEAHQCLGHLSELDTEQRISALQKRAGRQLLVALHEATLGRPFTDIVFDEYRAISSSQAKSLYLTVSILHRLGVKTRAGLISRIHQIPFPLFEAELFAPLAHIVFAEKDDRVRDYIYRSRHQHVAEILFECALPSPSDRYDEYLRIISALDIGYAADYNALRGLTKARDLGRLFPDVEMGRGVLDAASVRFPDESSLLQQRAILEMISSGGDLDRASKCLEAAERLAPWNKSIKHSRAELALRIAETAGTKFERTKWRNESRRVASELLHDGNTTSHPYHTLLKVRLSELEETLSNADPTTIERDVKEIERTLTNARQRFPGDSYLLDAESRFSAMLNQVPRATNALTLAFARNKKNAYLALRLAKLHESRSEFTKAIAILRECLEANPNDRDIHFRLGLLLFDNAQGSLDVVRHHLRNSFTDGDARHEATFHYARACYLAGEYVEARKWFRRVSEAPVSQWERRRIRSFIMKDGQKETHFGVLTRKNSFSGWIAVDGTGQTVFVHGKNVSDCTWNELTEQGRVSFFLGFNFQGPIATDVAKEAN